MSVTPCAVISYATAAACAATASSASSPAAVYTTSSTVSSSTVLFSCMACRSLAMSARTRAFTLAATSNWRRAAASALSASIYAATSSSSRAA
uniref:Uncharacterized protein n=1 Tax=uncultured marine virus TaxID=186617 RepID=A0A0F7L2C7_9VIRU|nr:hypothetical protein [uncultured marine virus]